MRFVVDTNLPPVLSRWLVAAGHDAEHAAEIFSPEADDSAIWARAVQSGSIVITKDTDYLDLAARSGGARVVLLRCGNLKLGPFRAWFDGRWPAVESLLLMGEDVVEVR